MSHTVWGKVDDNYIISIDGSIRSLDRVHLIARRGSPKPYKRKLKGAEVSSRESNKGYMRVQMGKRAKMHYVHRLVLATFVGNKEYPQYQCDHINHNRADNRLENLEWVTQSENIQRSIKSGSKLKVNTFKGYM